MFPVKVLSWKAPVRKKPADQAQRILMVCNVRKIGVRIVLPLLGLGLGWGWLVNYSLPGLVPKDPPADTRTVARNGSETMAPEPGDPLAHQFTTQVLPFLQRYCFSCHGPKKACGPPRKALTPQIPARITRHVT